MQVFNRVSHPTVVAISVVLFFMFIFFVLPSESKSLAEITGEGISPDTQWTYSVDSLLEMAEAYGDAGRLAYVYAKLRFDIAWPLVYGLLAASTAAYVMKRFQLERFKGLLWFSALAICFDLFENTFVSVVFLSFPSASRGIAMLATWMTPLKWTSLSIAFLSPVLLLVLHLVFFKKRPSR